MTLFNAKLKILVKVLTKRLAHNMSGIINEAKMCAIPNISIHNNLSLIRYSLEVVNRVPGKGGTLVYIDQSKTFNRVNRWYLLLVLMTDKLGLTFLSWIIALYIDINSIIWANCFSSKLLYIKCTVHQEYLFSSLLYVLALEPLSKNWGRWVMSHVI